MSRVSDEKREAEARVVPTRRMRIAFTLLFALAIGLGLYVVWPFRAALVLAAVLASVLHGPFRALDRLFHGRSAAAAATTTLALLLLIVGPLAAVLAFAVGQLVKGVAFVRDELGIHDVSALRTGHLPKRARDLFERFFGALHINRTQLDELFHRASDGAQSALSHVVESSSRATYHTAIMLLAFYFFLVEGRRMTAWLRRISPLEERQTHDLLDEFRAVSRASILGNAMAALFQGVTATLGYVITGVPHAIFFGLCTLIASFIPIVGTLIVWVPAVAFLWLLDHHAASLVLAIWCVVLVVGGEHIGKPFALRYVLAGREEMHTGIVFLSLLGGLEMFGLIGLALGPLVFAFLLAMLRIYERDFQVRASDGGPLVVTPPPA